MKTPRSLPSFALALIAGLSATSCSSAYYGMMESFGVEKRDIMVDRVEEARDDQEEARDQFKTTLEQFKALTNFEGGELESTYEKLADEYEASADAAATVRDRIESIESVAEALFDEWSSEIQEIQDPAYSQKSQQMLDQTQRQYEDMIGAMWRAEEKMAPILQAFKDQVLFLKHSLNAQAIASLQGTVIEIEGDVNALIADMERSIEEANRFIDGMKGASS